MAKQIFRNVVLARMASPDQLDQMIRVTSWQRWIALLAAMMILGTAVAWGFKGRLPTKAEGKAVVVRAGSLLTVSTLSQGQVVRMLVKNGDHVEPGQLIAEVGQPEISNRITAARAQLADAEKQGQRQTEATAASLKLELDSSAKQRAAILQQIDATQQQIVDVAEQIPGYEDLLAKGLVTRQQLLGLKEKKASLASNVTSLRSQLAQLAAGDFKVQNSGKQTELQLENQLADLRRNVRLLEGQMSLNSEVRSPYAGQVIQVQTQQGALLASGASILTLQPDVKELEVVAFISALKAKEVKPGMEAQVILASVRPEEFGFIKGQVSKVAEYPSSDADLMRVFQNNALASAMAGGPLHEVRVLLKKSAATTSGYEWSSKNGAPVSVTPATICTVSVITREQAPVTLVLPAMKQFVGMGR